jgi:hypothetical protein
MSTPNSLMSTSAALIHPGDRVQARHLRPNGAMTASMRPRRLADCCQQPRPDEWLATVADPVRAQSALDRFTSRAYDRVIEGESYRTRLKPRGPAPRERAPPRG